MFKRLKILFSKRDFVLKGKNWKGDFVGCAAIIYVVKRLILMSDVAGEWTVTSGDVKEGRSTFCGIVGDFLDNVGRVMRRDVAGLT